MSSTRTPPPIVIAYDGSDHASAAIDHAAVLFPGRAARVLTAWTSVRQMARAGRAAMPRDVIATAVRNLDAETEEHAAETAAAGAALARAAGLDAQAVTVEAHPTAAAGVLADAEEQGAAVIVVGSRGRSDVRSLLLGSVSRALIHHATCPVLVVRLAADHPRAATVAEPVGASA